MQSGPRMSSSHHRSTRKSSKLVHKKHPDRILGTINIQTGCYIQTGCFHKLSLAIVRRHCYTNEIWLLQKQPDTICGHKRNDQILPKLKK